MCERTLSAPALALVGPLGQVEVVPGAVRGSGRAGAAAGSAASAGRGRETAQSDKHHRISAKSSQNKVNLLYSYNLFQRSLILGAVAIVFNRCRHNKAV